MVIVMAKNSNNETFVRVTNEDIYKKLCELEDHVKCTNGKVKLNFWIASTAMTLIVVTLGFLFNHMRG